MWERKRRGVDREGEREREQSDPSCGEDTQEKCIPPTASTRKAAKQSGALTASFKHLLDNDGLLLASPGPAGSSGTHSAQTHTPSSRTAGSAALAEVEDFTEWGKADEGIGARIPSAGECTAPERCLSAALCVGSFSEVKYVFQHACVSRAVIIWRWPLALLCLFH